MPWVSAQRLGRERTSSLGHQEDLANSGINNGVNKPAYAGLKSRPAPPPPFRFGYRRQPIDWRILHGIDIQRMVIP